MLISTKRSYDSIPFISDRKHDKDDSPFADLKSANAVDNPAKMLEGWTEEPRASVDIEVEAQVAEWNTVPAGLLDLLARRRRAVCRVIVPPGQIDYKDRPSTSGWTGTAFLVAKNILLTNHHVLSRTENARTATVEFEYEIPPDDLIMARLDAQPTVTRLQLKPERLFLTSKVIDGLDFTFVWIDEAAATKFGTIPMERSSFTVNRFDPTYIIHHPLGRRKEASLDDTEALRMRSTVIHYAADTDYGSSGAPVFDRNGRLIALHHARSEAEADTLQDGRPVKVVNEGIKISAIAIHLENRIKRGGTDSEYAREVLEHIQGSDTLSSFFGALGRRTEGASDVDAVVSAYSGTEQDIDIGFWNIEGLTNRYKEPEKLDAVARVIADLNLDIWGLVEVPATVVRELVKMLKAKFGESYGCAFSEPHAFDEKPATAVIWRNRTVEVQREEWPPNIERRWHLHSTAVQKAGGQNKIFNDYPALYRFTVKREPADEVLDFYLVPLHLKAKNESGKQRRLASALLTESIREMVADGGYDKDWILGGDYKALLASDDFAALQDANFEPLSAEDEASGAITYLKSPRSLIHTIFLSPNFSRFGENRDYFIVTKERSLDKYVSRVSDHRPIVMRLALGTAPSTESKKEIERELDVLIGPGKRSRIRASRRDLPTLEIDGSGQFVWQNLTKQQFLEQNRNALDALLADINNRLQAAYGAGYTPVTTLDAWVLTYIEAGINRATGKVDPDHRHSLGERGLLPLPERISYWNGAGAPDPNRPMPLATNLLHFYLYLGHLKNKAVLARPDGVTLYRDLFKWAGIAGSALRQCKLLAGVVHGYFYSGNFSDRKVPLEPIMDGYVRDRGCDDILRGTTYVHAGSSILANRERNIVAALRLHG
jgi:hypothetical protein